MEVDSTMKTLPGGKINTKITEDIKFEGAQYSGDGIHYVEDSSSLGEEEQQLDCESHSPLRREKVSTITVPPSVSKIEKPALVDSYKEDCVGERLFLPTDGDNILKTNEEYMRNVNYDDRVDNRGDECGGVLNKIMHSDSDILTSTECLSVSVLVGGGQETTDGAHMRMSNTNENGNMKSDEATRALGEQMNVGRNDDDCGSSQNDDEECVYKRGYSLIHKLKGEKITIKAWLRLDPLQPGQILLQYKVSCRCQFRKKKTEVESVQPGKTYIADMDKCPKDKYSVDKCRGYSCNLLYMFPGSLV